MAEHVHQNLEGMLPELEEFEQLSIFTKKEIRSIIKRRTDFEYRLQKRTTEKQDFLRYIQYEINLDILKKKRKLTLGLKKPLKGEYETVKRLHLLFKKALQKFKHDTKLWLQYIEYCKQAGGAKSLSNVFGQLLKFHPHNPTFWVMAAKWEFEDGKNIPAARSLLQRGLRMNAESKLLWLEYFRMELLHVDKVMKRRTILGLANTKENEDDDEVTDAFLACKAAEIVFKKAIETIPDDISFRLSFLKIYRLFDNTKQGQDLVFESLKKDFSDDEEFWNVLAYRPVEDLLANNNLKGNRDIAEAEEERDKTFKQAVKELPTEKMWDYYVSAVSSGLDKKDTKNSCKVAEKCMEICHTAYKKNLLSSQSFNKWIHILLMTGKTSQALHLLKERSLTHRSISVYYEYLRLLILQESDQNKITKEFWAALDAVEKSSPSRLGILKRFRIHKQERLYQQEIINVVIAKKSKVMLRPLGAVGVVRIPIPQDSMLLWKLFLDWSISTNKGSVSSIFEKSIELNDEVGDAMRTEYIEWLAATEGIEKARKICKRFCKNSSVSLSFLRKCVILEQAQLSPSLSHVRQLYDVILNKHGPRDADLWIEYIGFELKEGSMESAGRLHWKAIKTLSGSDLEEFISKYSLVQAGQLHATDMTVLR